MFDTSNQQRIFSTHFSDQHHVSCLSSLAIDSSILSMFDTSNQQRIFSTHLSNQHRVQCLSSLAIDSSIPSNSPRNSKYQFRRRY